jgi:plastocyanin
MSRLVVLAVVAALFATACSSGPPAGSGAPPRSSPPSGPQTFTVSVDGKAPSFSLAADAYFPSTLEVHPGDTIRFRELFSGEPHTVTFGTLVDAAAAAGSAGSSPSPASPATALPSILPKGRGDAVQSAAQPCFLETGAPPADTPCPRVPQPPFAGRQTFYNSGWLADGSTFSVVMSGTIRPGTYAFRCLVHPGMTGRVEVVAPDQAIPTPAQVTADGAAQLARVVQAQTPAARDAASVTTTPVAGITQTDVTNSLVAMLGPPEIDVPAGQIVSWSVYGLHVLALDPPDGAMGLLVKGSDGAVHLNQTAVDHVGGAAPPSGPVSRPQVVGGGSYGGSGFHSSGLLTSFPPGLLTYTLRFTAPGAYTVRCLVHPAMTQTVRVS